MPCRTLQFQDFVLNRHSLTDKQWQVIQKLDSVEWFQGVVNDDDIRYVAQFPKLRTLQGSGSITDTAKKHLESLPGF